MKDLATDDAIQNLMPWIRTRESDPVLLLTREWLVTNGLGGYSSASVSGAFPAEGPRLKQLRAKVSVSGRRSYFPSRRTTEPFSKK